MLEADCSFLEIATALGRTVFAVKGEIKRGGGHLKYNPEYLARESSMKRRPFTLKDRLIIQEYLEKGRSRSEICEQLGRTVGSINHEIDFNGGSFGYDPQNAHGRRVDSASRIVKKDLKQRIENIEFQLEIITQTIQEILNGKNN